MCLQAVDQKRLDRADAKLKQKQEKRVLKEQAETASGTKVYVVGWCLHLIVLMVLRWFIQIHALSSFYHELLHFWKIIPWEMIIVTL